MLVSDNYFAVEGHKRLVSGSRQYGRVARLLPLEGATDDLHDELRNSLHALRGAMNYLDYHDTAGFETAHARLDAAGKLAREEFPDGCQLAYHDGAYHQECPVALAHNRIGLSVGIKIKTVECSICRSDPDDCDHMRGREYGGQALACVHVITEADIMEFSTVGRPAQPDARITSVSVATNKLKRKLGKKFRHGVPVTCDMCLSRCGGIHRPYEKGV